MTRDHQLELFTSLKSAGGRLNTPDVSVSIVAESMSQRILITMSIMSDSLAHAY